MSNYNLNLGGAPLSGDPSPYSVTIPAELDFRNKFKSYSLNLMSKINTQTSYLQNPIPGIATPEQTKATMEAFGKTADSAGLNKASGFKGFLGKSGIGNNAINTGVSAATNIIKGVTPQAEDNGSLIAGLVANTAGDIAMMFPGIGTAIGAGLKGLSTLITSVGPHVRGNTAKELTDRSSSYGGLGKLDSKKFGLFGIGAGKRYRKKVQERELFRGLSEGILANANLNKDATAGAIQNMANKYNLEKMGGWQQTNGIRFGKTGMKYDLTFAHNVMNLKPSKMQDGGTIRTLDQLIEYAKKINPRFILRMSEPVKSINLGKDSEGNDIAGTHLMSWATFDDGNAMVYSQILEDDKGNLKLYEPKEAMDRAWKMKNYLLMNPEEAKLFTESPDTTKGYKKGWPKFFEKFKEGGKMNVIPDGALHARKHNIEDSSLDGKITKKGIPVMHNDGGELTQVAEIEKNEIIFTKEVTEKLEELRDKGTEEAAIEAGKLLVQEILYNTQDNTGLLKLIG